MKLKVVFTVGICHLFVNYAWSQDPLYSQNFASPLQLNPSLAGTAHTHRIVAQYRNQWPNFLGNYINSNLAYDQKIDAINSGVGLLVSGDWQSSGTLQTYAAHLFYSFHYKISENLTLLYGASLGFATKRVDWSAITFGDIIDPTTGLIYNQGNISNNKAIRYADISTGFAGHTKNFHFGIAAHHINSPKYALNQGNNSTLPIRFTAHTGLDIKLLKDENNEGKLVISPNLIYRYQNEFQEFLLGSYFKFNNCTIGAFYRERDAVLGIIGYQLKKFKMAYSYDYTISKLTNQSGGSHEISLGYCFKHIERTSPFPNF